MTYSVLTIEADDSITIKTGFPSEALAEAWGEHINGAMLSWNVLKDTPEVIITEITDEELTKLKEDLDECPDCENPLGCCECSNGADICGGA